MARTDTELDILECILHGQEKPCRLELSLLRTITENFSDARIIGSGGCGDVYKGILGNGTVAVKKLFKTRTIDEKMFDREVHSMMTVKHENIVQFLGYCSDTQGESIEIGGKRFMGDVRERLLCFEYIQNGSLKNYIKDELRGLKWHERYQIIKGICEGLHYLHKEKHICHMDLKPDNVLLGDHLVPKITDFGLATLDDKSQTTSEHRFFSPGYSAPEYHHYGRKSAKSDIYSLGVIILELVTGSKEEPDIAKVLRRWRHRWSKSSDDTLWYRQVAKCLDLAQWCKQNNPLSRPNIWDIISELNKIDSWDGQIRYAAASTFDKVMSCLVDMLGIEPLEMHFPFDLNEPISCSIEVKNDTDDYFAFRIASTSLLPFSTQPDKGIVEPRSKLSATVTLQAQEKVQLQNHCSEEVIVQSSRIDGIPTSLDVAQDMFNNVVGRLVDEVSLTVVFDMPPTREEPQVDMDNMNYQEAHKASYEPHSRADNGSLRPSTQPSSIPWDSLPTSTLEGKSSAWRFPMTSGTKAPYTRDGAGATSGVSELDLEIEEGIEIVDRGLPVGSSQRQQPVAIIPQIRAQLRHTAGEYLFKPVTMPIGPYHQKDGSFTSTEEKKKAVRHLEGLGVDFAYLKRVLAALGPQARRCYSHLLDDQYVPEVFSRMLLHDGCYLLNFFIGYEQQRGAAASLQGGDGQQDIHTKDNRIVRDFLYLLENQMPLFVLCRMHRIIAKPEAKSALEFISWSVENFLQKQHYISKMTRPSAWFKPPHLLHLVYSYFEVTAVSYEPPGAALLTGRWRRATDYSRYADLKFKRRSFMPDDKWTILDIHLQGGTLYIPFLRVGSSTFTMLRNMMALEEQHEKRPVTAYCYFMSQLVCKEEDVDLLQRAHILEHFLGSDEQAAQCFAELCNGVALDVDKLERNYLKPIWHELDRRCREPDRTFMGSVRQTWQSLLP